MTWKDISVSMLDSVHSREPRTITLGAWVRATKRSDIRTPKKQRPALMPHGLFAGGRQAQHCSQLSELVQFDVDLKHNPGLNPDEVKSRCALDADIVWCAQSAGGGVYGFAMRRGDLDTQLNTIENRLGVVLDRCNSRSVAALRFASHDPKPYEHIRQAAG